MLEAPWVTSFVHQLDDLTRPPSWIRDEGERRRVRLFTLLTCVGLLSTVLTIIVLVISRYPLNASDLLIIPAAFALIVLSRGRLYRVGMVVAIVVNYGWAINTIMNADRRDYATLLLVMPVVFVSLVFSTRITMISGLVSVGLAFVVGSTENGLSEVVSFSALFIFMISFGIVVAAELRERDNRKLTTRAEALSQSESRYRALFHSSPIPLSEEDFTALHAVANRLTAQGIQSIEAHLYAHPEVVEEIFRSLEVIEVNPATLALYRANSLAEFMPYFAPKYFERNAVGLAGSVAAMWRGELEHSYEAVDYTLDGEPFECRIRWVRLSDKPLRIVVSIEDLTPIKRAERQQQELAIERARVELLQRFLGDTTHDLLTPITIINTSVHLGMKTDDSDQLHERLTTIQIQANHLQTMISDMLTMSRLDSPTETAFRFVVGDLNLAIGGIVREFEPLAQGKRQQIGYSPAPQALSARYDEHIFGRALRNLIQNAIKYTPEGGSIRVSSQQHGGIIQVRVSDSGVGIPGHELPHIFERFYRVDAHRPIDGGTGLGLAIVKKIVQAHDGHIDVESIPGKGTTFTIHLPTVVAEASPA